MGGGCHRSLVLLYNTWEEVLSKCKTSSSKPALCLLLLLHGSYPFGMIKSISNVNNVHV